MLTLLVVVSRQPDHSAPSSRLFASSQVTKSPVAHPLSIQQVTKCFFSNSFVLKTIHLSWGGTSPGRNCAAVGNFGEVHGSFV